MNSWNSQHFQEEATARGRPKWVIDNALWHANRIRAVNQDQAVVFTLEHLARCVKLDVNFLEAVAARVLDPYRSFLLKKRNKPGSTAPARRYRTICVPSPDLARTQRWIHCNILQHAIPHAASCAYGRGNTVFEAARRHTNARWLIKIDVHRFFESITEPYVEGVFEALGYPKLLSFQLARLCTRLPTKESQREKFTVRKKYEKGILKHNSMGFLPQGAPTSPVLANLVMQRFDEDVRCVATAAELRYTRYADDLIFSTKGSFTRASAKTFIKAIYQCLGKRGFEANRTKTVISPPGARKIVLGLLVDGDEPRLTRDFKERLLMHAHFASRSDIGPVAHAKARKFASVIGFQNHLYGLVGFANQIEPMFAKLIRAKLSQVKWPA